MSIALQAGCGRPGTPGMASAMARTACDPVGMIDRQIRTLNADMKNLGLGILIGAVVSGLLVGLAWFIADSTSAPEPAAAPAARSASPPGSRASGSEQVLDLICELQLDLDGQMALGINANEPSRIALAQIDFGKSSGWYQGKLSISEGRAGALTVKGNKLQVSRPAMFQRFGVTITREDFTVDRSTGSFTQSLTLSDARVVPLIRGTCAKVIKPPF